MKASKVVSAIELAASVTLQVLKVGFVISAVAFIALLGWMYIPDTDSAPGFSERKFKQVKIGMTREDVKRLLGKPLYSLQNDDGTIRLAYTIYGDAFVWRSRALTLSNDTVTAIEARLIW